MCIVSNPSSGASNQNKLQNVVLLLRNEGAKVEQLTTTSHGEGGKVAGEAANSGRFDVVVAAGGDGTIHDVACGLIGTRCPLGIIPMGTANVFAREIGLDFSASGLADTLLSGTVQSIPVGRVNGEIFLFVVGIGFDAAALEYFESGNHRWLGIGGFVPPVLRALVATPSVPLTVTIDGKSHTAHWVIVTRVAHYAAKILLAPEASLTDEKLHVVMFSGDNMLVRMRQLAAMLTGMLKFDPEVTILPCNQLLIEANQPAPVQIDGEAKGILPLAIGIHPTRLNVIFPNS